MIRRTDWQWRLDAFFQEHRQRLFEYGRWDCCLFVGDAIRAMTGVDPAAAIRGAYDSRATARAVARRYASSFEGAVAGVCAGYSMEEVPVMHARRGDVALIRRERYCSLGIVALNGRDVVLIADAGLWRTPLTAAARAWHV